MLFFLNKCVPPELTRSFLVGRDSGEKGTAAAPRLYQSSRDELQSQIDIATQQLTQREQELREVTAFLQQANRSYDLARQELSHTEPPVASGAVSEVESLRLKLAVSRVPGAVAKLGASPTRIPSVYQDSQQLAQPAETH